MSRPFFLWCTVHTRISKHTLVSKPMTDLLTIQPCGTIVMGNFVSHIWPRIQIHWWLLELWWVSLYQLVKVEGIIVFRFMIFKVLLSTFTPIYLPPQKGKRSQGTTHSTRYSNRILHRPGANWSAQVLSQEGRWNNRCEKLRVFFGGWSRTVWMNQDHNFQTIVWQWHI